MNVYGRAAEKSGVDTKGMSKKQKKKLTRLSVAELKQLVNRPDVVEMHDANAPDPTLLVYLKAYRNSKLLLVVGTPALCYGLMLVSLTPSQPYRYRSTGRRSASICRANEVLRSLHSCFLSSSRIQASPRCGQLNRYKQIPLRQRFVAVS